MWRFQEWFFMSSLQILMHQLVGPSTGEEVKLIKLQGLKIPVITSASQSSAGTGMITALYTLYLQLSFPPFLQKPHYLGKDTLFRQRPQ
jgi:hypothetical protein